MTRGIYHPDSSSFFMQKATLRKEEQDGFSLRTDQYLVVSYLSLTS